ncbi:transcription initiation factor TFIID subunit 7 [Chironomus tepperi]|uniref:transcription initiation factor TFIID subunit 7 n=1 Tax=Chironomus tepperi TaxID=113505 RepID=UPI00391EE860
MAPDKPQKAESRRDEVDLETQFILRLPEEYANKLRDAIRSGAQNLKERLAISLENDLRKGMVRFDERYLYAKVVDLPCIIESHKTIDKKSFYKTSDICQMMICKEEPDPVTDDESPVKNKKKDPNKVDKKFLYPHGVTPSLKNVRKRRFRKTLKKKNVELPEIEKEVKRLLRTDNEAVNVKWEIVESEEPVEAEHGRESPVKSKKEQASTSKGHAKHKAVENLPVDEHHIFGEELSDSEEENINAVVPDIDIEDTRLSEDSRSRFSDSNSMMQGMQSASNSQLPLIDQTEFSSSMFEEDVAGTSSQNIDEESVDYSASKEHSMASNLRRELQELRVSQAQIEQEIQTIDNKKLKERLQDDLENIMGKIIMKQIELQEFEEQ